MENLLFEMLRNKYQVGNHFISAYLTYLFGNDNLDMAMFDQKLTNPNVATWLDYALSTNMRGRAFAEILRPYFPNHAQRYLDIGSAYGGFLIGFMELGLEVMGIEVDEKLVNLSRANFKDYGQDDVSIRGNILDESLISQMGKFDVITCIDVIEHVDDVPRAMKNMVRLLNPGGILALQTPNKNSLSNVMADSHFNLYGITLLNRADARRYFYCYFHNTDPYDVGEYHTQEYYIKSLTQLGCKPSILPTLCPVELSEEKKLIKKYILRMGQALTKKPGVVPFELKIKIALRSLKNIAEFLCGLGIFSLMPETQRQSFKNKFVDNTWFIIGKSQ